MEHSLAIWDGAGRRGPTALLADGLTVPAGVGEHEKRTVKAHGKAKQPTKVMFVCMGPERVFADGRVALAHYGLRGEEAELLHQWGRLLGVPERLDEAAELYRRHHAGRPWLERVEEHRRRLS